MAVRYSICWHWPQQRIVHFPTIIMFIQHKKTSPATFICKIWWHIGINHSPSTCFHHKNKAPRMINTIPPWKEQKLVNMLLSAVQSTFAHFNGRRYGALQLANNEHVQVSHFSAALYSSSWFSRLCVDKSPTVTWWKLGWWGIHGCSDKSMLKSGEAQLLPVTTTYNWAMTWASTNEFRI